MSNIPIDVFGHLFSNTYGVQLAGLLVSGALYGASVLQAFIYYMSNPKDELLLKAFPGWLILISTVHQFILSVGVYKGLVNHFGDESVLTLLIPEVFYRKHAPRSLDHECSSLLHLPDLCVQRSNEDFPPPLYSYHLHGFNDHDCSSNPCPHRKLPRCFCCQ